MSGGRWYERGFAKQTILDIFHLIDWMMSLPPELEEQFEVELETYEKERKMPYVTSIERKGIEKGKQQGMQQGMQQGRSKEARRALLRVVTSRFGPPRPEISEKIEAEPSVDTLEAWFDASLDAQTVDDIFATR